MSGRKIKDKKYIQKEDIPSVLRSLADEIEAGNIPMHGQSSSLDSYDGYKFTLEVSKRYPTAKTKITAYPGLTVGGLLGRK